MMITITKKVRGLLEYFKVVTSFIFVAKGENPNLGFPIFLS